MAYIEKIVGNTCGQCHKAKYVKNPSTGKIFCADKCWLNGTNAQTTPQNAPQASFDPIQNDLQVKIDELNVTISKMRLAFQNHEDRIKALETFVLGANKTAFDLHSGHTEIPIIQATDGDKVNIDFPPGFLK